MKKSILLVVFLASFSTPAFASTLSSAYTTGSVSQNNFIARDVTGQVIDYSSLPITNDGYINAVNQYNNYCVSVQGSKNVELEYATHHSDVSIALINQKYNMRFPDCEEAFKVVNSFVLDAVARLKSGSTVSQIQCDYGLIFDMKYQSCQSREVAEKDNAPVAVPSVTQTASVATSSSEEQLKTLLAQIIIELQAKIAAILKARGQ